MPQIFSVTVVGVLFALILDPRGPAERAYTALFGGSNAFLGSSTWLRCRSSF